MLCLDRFLKKKLDIYRFQFVSNELVAFTYHCENYFPRTDEKGTKNINKLHNLRKNN